MKKPIPTWIVVLSFLIGSLGIAVGISLYMSPADFIPDTDFSSPQIRYLSNMWAARQLAIAAVIIYASVRRSSPMLRASLVIYAIMNLQDIFIGISMQDTGLAIGATVFFLLPSVMVYVLMKRRSYAGEPDNA